MLVLVVGATLLGGVGSQSRTSKLMFVEVADWGRGERALFPCLCIFWYLVGNSAFFYQLLGLVRGALLVCRPFQ